MREENDDDKGITPPDSFGASLAGVSSSKLEELVLEWFLAAFEAVGKQGSYTAVVTGGSDSTKPDIHVIGSGDETGNDNNEFYVEVKKAMAAAGYQCTLHHKSKTNRWEPSSSSLFSEGILNFMHSAVTAMLDKVDEQERRGEEASGYAMEYFPTGEELEDVYGILQNKYWESDVRLFVSVRDDGTCCIFDPRDINALARNIEPRVVVRPKTSGSQSIREKEIAEVERLLQAHQVDVDVLIKNKKVIVSVKDFESWDKDEISRINKELDTRSRRDNIRGIKSGKLFPFIGDKGIVRKRSETMSMTFLIQTHLGSNSETVTFREFVDFVNQRL